MARTRTRVKQDKKESTLTLQEQKARKQMLSNIVSYIILGIVSIVFVLPLWYTIVTSFKYPGDVFDGKILAPNPAIKPLFYNFFGQQRKLDKEIAKDFDYDGALYAGWDEKGVPPFVMAYFNSLMVGVLVVVLQLLTCSLAAYAFARLKWPGRDQVFLAYLGTMMVPGQVTMIPVYILFKNLGIVDTRLALILPAAFSAYGTFMLRQYFMSIPAALEEAAVIDGAKKIQILLQIIMPLAKTALSTLAIFVFLFSWNDFMWPLVVINSDAKKTLPIALQSFQTSYGAQWHLIMAASLIVLVPVVAIFIAGQKYITKGIMMSGIK